MIDTEQQGLDVAFWYMADAEFSNRIVKRSRSTIFLSAS